MGGWDLDERVLHEGKYVDKPVIIKGRQCKPLFMLERMSQVRIRV